MAAVEFDQNLTFKGDEQDFIRQVHSELYQLETETYGLGCPGCGVNSNCCTCKYWDERTCYDPSGRPYDCSVWAYKSCCIGHAGATVTLTAHTLDGVYHPDPNDPPKRRTSYR